MPRQLDVLAQHDGISFQGFATRRDGAALTVEPRYKLAVNTTEAAIQAALAGIGIIRVLSYQISDELCSGAAGIADEYAPERLPVNVVHGRAEPLPLKVHCLLD